MSEGRCSLLLHFFHPALPFSPSPRASARPSVKLITRLAASNLSKEWVSTGLSCYVDADTSKGPITSRVARGSILSRLMLRSPQMSLLVCVYV